MKKFGIHILVIAFAAIAATASADEAILKFGYSLPGAKPAAGAQESAPIQVTINVDDWKAASRDSRHGQGAGKVSMSSFTIMKTYDKASPMLAQICGTGQHIPRATLFVRKAGGKQEEYMTIEMENVMVSGYSISSGGDRPMESISFNFAKMEFKYASQKDQELNATQSDKDRMKGWDQKTNKGGR